MNRMARRVVVISAAVLAVAVLFTAVRLGTRQPSLAAFTAAWLGGALAHALFVAVLRWLARAEALERAFAESMDEAAERIDELTAACEDHGHAPPTAMLHQCWRKRRGRSWSYASAVGDWVEGETGPCELVHDAERLASGMRTARERDS